MKTRLTIAPGKWRPVVGNHPELLSPVRPGERCYFPHVVLPVLPNRFNDQLTVNVGSFDMPVHDSNAILIAFAPQLWRAARRFVESANTRAAFARFEQILRDMERTAERYGVGHPVDARLTASESEVRP